MKLLTIPLLFCILVFSYCNFSEPSNIKNRVECDSFDTAKFFHLIKTNWPTRNPNSITDAVRMLDSMADDNFRCAVIKFNDVDLYFNLGSTIRNKWIRHGTESIRDQIFNKLKLSNVDYSSGIIIDIYRQYLINKNVDLVKKYLTDKSDSSLATRETELKSIQKELFSTH